MSLKIKICGINSKESFLASEKASAKIGENSEIEQIIKEWFRSNSKSFFLFSCLTIDVTRWPWFNKPSAMFLPIK